MNLLAHAYLSFENPNLLVGNMISDFVKGKSQYDYPEAIQRGIGLHREIDRFTDAHPVTQRAKQLYRPAYRLYAGAFVDVTYDYFLANDVGIFPEAASLEEFTVAAYSTLEGQVSLFPPVFRAMFPFMKAENWLLHYREYWGIARSFEGLVRRARYLQSATEAIQIFRHNERVFQSYYEDFFPDLEAFARKIANLPGNKAT